MERESAAWSQCCLKCMNSPSTKCYILLVSRTAQRTTFLISRKLWFMTENNSTTASWRFRNKLTLSKALAWHKTLLTWSKLKMGRLAISNR
jgi:hypothetical protein